MYWVVFVTAWAVVGLDLLAGERSLPGTVAGIWVAGQAVGLALQTLGVGVKASAFWVYWANSPDGGIDGDWTRRGVWLVHDLLEHFSLLQHDMMPRGRAVQAQRDEHR